MCVCVARFHGKGPWSARLTECRPDQHFFFRQVSHLAQLYGAERRLFVSMYESNSRDATPLWLQELRVELAALGVPHEIVSGGGGEEKGGGGGARGAEDRIAFLARMRNRSMRGLAGVVRDC